MEAIEMPEDLPRRRWEDVERAIQAAVTTAVSAAVIQWVTPMRLTLDRIEDEVQLLKHTTYGNPQIHQPGVVQRLNNIENKIDAVEDKIENLIDSIRARDNQMLGARKMMYVLSTFVVLIGGPPALISIFKTLGVIP